MGKVAIIKYETSEGLETLQIKNAENILVDVDGEKGVIYIEKRTQEARLISELAIISLESFVSFSTQEREVEKVEK